MPVPWRKQKGNNKNSLQQKNSIVDPVFKKHGDLAKKPSKKKHQCKQSPVITEESDTDQFNASINERKQENNEVCDPSRDDNISHNGILRHDCSNDGEDEEKGGTNDGILGWNKAVCLLVLKGSLIVGVVILIRRFILGIILGSFLLLLFEYVGDLIIQYCGACEPFVRMIQGFVYTCDDDSNECKEHVEANNGLSDVKECDSGTVSDEEKEDEVVNNLVFSLSRKIVDQDDGNVVGMNGGMEHESVQKFVIKDSKRIDDEMWDKIVTTIESLDPNGAQGNSSCYAPGGLCELQGINLPISGTEEEEALKMANQNCKTKKGKKFWKKFAIKNRKNKHKNNRDEQHESDGCDMNNDCTEKFEPYLGDDDNEYDGNVPGNFDSLFQDSRIRNHKFTCDNCVLVSDGMLRLRGTNSKFLIMILVALGGLTQGRIFALILTIISGFVMKMMKI